ncbi:OPT oligopeptide transporter protein-domain-containing protein, partial [Chytriomyces sp. MP71]
LKLGHYLKVPPRTMFLAPLVSTVLLPLFQTVLLAADNPASGWSSNSYNTFLSVGAIWGAIAPARFFGPESPYFKTLLGFAVEGFLPPIFWCLHKLQPNSFWHLVNIPLTLIFPAAAGSRRSDLITPLLISVFDNYFIRNYRHTWWKKYAYVMSAAFDSG